MISYLGSLVQFSPAAGRAALQADVAVCGERSPCSGHTGFAPHRGVCAFPVYTAQAPGCSIWSGPCVECGSRFRVLHKSADSVAPACCVFPATAAQAARGLAPSPQVRPAFSLGGPSARRRSQEVFRQDPGPVCQLGGGGFSGAEFAPCPSPCLLPPAGMGQLFSGVSQSLCFANRWRCVPAG